MCLDVIYKLPNVAASDFLLLMEVVEGKLMHNCQAQNQSLAVNSDITKVPEPEETKVYATPPKGQSNVVYNPAPETRVDLTS